MNNVNDNNLTVMQIEDLKSMRTKIYAYIRKVSFIRVIIGLSLLILWEEVIFFF